MNPYREPSKPASRFKQFFVNRKSWLRISPLTVFLAAVLLAGVSLAATAALRVNGIKVGPNDSTFYVAAFGAKGDGTTDDTAAIQAAITAAPTGATVYFSAATYLVTSSITVPKAYIHLVGSGTGTTFIKFNPAGAAAAFVFANGAVELTGDSIEKMQFISTGTNTQTKTAIQASDVDGFVAKDIWVDPNNSSTWTGTSSVGIQILGRQVVTLQRIRAFTDVPIKISVDPNISTLTLDHAHFSDLYLRPTPGTGGSAILVDSGVILTNLTIDGYNAFIADKYGFFWSAAGGAAINSYNIQLQGIRCEQFTDVTGYCIYIEQDTGLQNLWIRNAGVFGGANGVHLGSTGAGIFGATISNSMFMTADATKKHLDIGTNVFDVLLQNDNWNPTTTVAMGSLTQVWATPKRDPTWPLPATALYVDSTTAGGVAMPFGGAGGLSTAGPITATATATWDTKDGTVKGATFDRTTAGTVTLGGTATQANLSTSGAVRWGVLSGGTLVPASDMTYDLGSTSLRPTHLYGEFLAPTVGSVVASATTIAPTGGIFHVSGTTAIATITAPAGCTTSGNGCCVHIIPDGLWSTTNAGNIATATTAVVSKMLIECYDPAAVKWYPSY